jgi:hypothetical protein
MRAALACELDQHPHCCQRCGAEQPHKERKQRAGAGDRAIHRRAPWPSKSDCASAPRRKRQAIQLIDPFLLLSDAGQPAASFALLSAFAAFAGAMERPTRRRIPARREPGRWVPWLGLFTLQRASAAGCSRSACRWRWDLPFAGRGAAQRPGPQLEAGFEIGLF